VTRWEGGGGEKSNFGERGEPSPKTKKKTSRFLDREVTKGEKTSGGRSCFELPDQKCVTPEKGA